MDGYLQNFKIVLSLPFRCQIYIDLELAKVSSSEAYSEPCQTSNMERFVKIVND